MGLDTIIANGGRILVVGGRWNRGWDTWKDNPRIVWWTGEQKDIVQALKNHNGRLPENIRGVVMSRFISHSEAQQVLAEARRQRALIMAMKNDGEITRILDEIFTPQTHHTEPETVGAQAEPEPAPLDAAPLPETTPMARPHGWLIDFVAKHHQPKLYNAAEGRRLFAIAKEQGLKTTEGSMIQSVRAYREKLGLVVASGRNKGKAPEKKPAFITTLPPKPEVKAKAKPISEVDTILSMMDDAIAGLKLIRENVVKLHKQNDEFVQLKSKLSALLGVQ